MPVKQWLFMSASVGHFVAGEEMGHFVAGTFCRWDNLSHGEKVGPFVVWDNLSPEKCRWDKMSPNRFSRVNQIFLGILLV